MTKEEIWSVSIQRVRDFFQAQPDVTAANGDSYTFQSVHITLEELEPTGSSIFSASRTRLVLEGPEEEVNAIHRRFFLQFLSAGG